MISPNGKREGTLAKEPTYLELKFDGPPVKRLEGAPVEAVVSSLTAIQRMVHIIGMCNEGRALSERLKPTIKVKREYTVVCRPSIKGSHIQPFTVESLAGQASGTAAHAREKLLETLKAIDAGDEKLFAKVVPSARERWFLTKAASGLLPPKDSGLEVTIRAGKRGPFAFRAERARAYFEEFDLKNPPSVEEETIAGKLKAIDYTQTIMVIKPGRAPTVRMDYPLQLENWLQKNVRKRLSITGKPKFNSRGDISSFKRIETIKEVEPHLPPIDRFVANGRLFGTNRPVSLPVTVYWAERLFGVKDENLGIDVLTSELDELREHVISELSFNWTQYAMAADEDLDEEAQLVAASLRSRFGPLD